MKSTLMRALAFLAVAIVAAVAGYCIGFRQAWTLGVMADAPVRGAIAVAQLNALDKNQLDPVRTLLEAEIDSGLMWWAEVEQSPMHGALNALSGQDLIPGNLRYVRRVATYRKAHPSPLADPAVIATMLESARTDDSDFADELAEGTKETDLAIARMIEKYGQ
jgi:hypothetical protein